MTSCAFEGSPTEQCKARPVSSGGGGVRRDANAPPPPQLGKLLQNHVVLDQKPSLQS